MKNLAGKFSRQWLVLIIFTFCLFIMAGVMVLSIGHYRINVSSSIPLGLYQEVPDQLAIGVYVELCPPVLPLFQEAQERGYFGSGKCPGQMGHIFKKLAARQGDIITMDQHGMMINGSLLSESIPLSHDPKMRPLHFWKARNYTLQDNELVLMGTHPKSFDSRYFGPIAKKQIVTVIKPVWLWEKKS